MTDAGRPRDVPPEQRDLMRDALRMSVNKNLVDVTTLLQWAHAEDDVGEKLRHVRQAMTLMRDLEAQLGDLEEANRRRSF